MQLTPSIILIALGGLALITQRNRWIVLGALLVQWAGIAWRIATLPQGSSTALVEIVTALASCGILFLTLRNMGGSAGDSQPATGGILAAVSDRIWLWAIAIVAGLAGYALALIYPLGGNEQDLIAFYWIVLPAVLALVIEGAREPVKLGAGLISLLNAGLLLVYTLSAASPSVALLALAALGRLAIASILGYTWLFLQVNYGELDLNTPFDLRDNKIAANAALALALMPLSGDQPQDLGGAQPEAVEDTGADTLEDEVGSNA